MNPIDGTATTDQAGGLAVKPKRGFTLGEAAALVVVASLVTATMLKGIHDSVVAGETSEVRHEIERVWDSSFSEADIARLRKSISDGPAKGSGIRLVERSGHFHVVMESPSTGVCTRLMDRVPLHVLEMTVSPMEYGDRAEPLEHPEEQCGKDGAVLSLAVARPSGLLLEGRN